MYSQRTRSWIGTQGTWLRSFRSPQPCLITFNPSGKHSKFVFCLLFTRQWHNNKTKNSNSRPKGKWTFFVAYGRVLLLLSILVEKYCLRQERKNEKIAIKLHETQNHTLKTRYKSHLFMLMHVNRKEFSRGILEFFFLLDRWKIPNYLHGNEEKLNMKIDFLLAWHFLWYSFSCCLIECLSLAGQWHWQLSITVVKWLYLECQTRYENCIQQIARFNQKNVKLEFRDFLCFAIFLFN